MFHRNTGLLSATLLLLLVSSSLSLPNFNDFVKSNNKQYFSEVEERFRKYVYNRNKDNIENHNKQTNSTYKQAENQFTDMTADEFVATILNNPITEDQIKSFVVGATNGIPASNSSINGSLPRAAATAKDWRTTAEVVGPIENQGSCGSCYAFSAIAALESQMKIKGRPSVVYSKQQTVSCCGNKGFNCNGCDGGWMWWVYNYIQSEGIVTQAAYPYTSGKTGNTGACKKLTGAVKILNKVSAFTYVSNGNASDLKAAVTKQPVSVAVDATNWDSYSSGIYPASKCSNSANSANHAVVVVGYDVNGNWIVRNSWGTTWGVKGYMTLQAGNTCGVANYGLVPNVI